MMSDKFKFTFFKEKNVRHVTFIDNIKRKVKGIGNIQNYPIIEHVLLVDRLKYDLLRISQLYDKDNGVIFKSLHFLVTHIIENKIIFIGKRLKNIYIIDSREIVNDVKCFSVMVDSSCICHRRLGHANI
jgi:hypothetical protein